MIVLGLDCASKTGWAFFDVRENRIVESGVQDFTKRRGESNGLMFMKFRKWLKELIEIQKPDIVGYEQAHFRGGAATVICVGLQTRVEEICVEKNIEPAPVATTTLKKFATGSGRAGKPEMVKAARKILGRYPIDDNEADAVHVSMWAAAEYAE